MDTFESHYKAMVSFDKYLGMDLVIEEPGKVQYTLKIESHHLTAPETAHGGVTAAMMDATLGVAALSLAVTNGNLCATVEFKINYIRQVGRKSILISKGWVKHAGNRLIVSQGDILDKATGDLIATGLGTFSQYPAKKRRDVEFTTLLN